jgi:Lecithin retinol acyltransferase
MNAGDLLVVHCWYGPIPYSHYAIDMGDGTVIQLASDPDRSKSSGPDLSTICVRQSTMAEFSAGRPVHEVKVANSHSADTVLERAKSKLGLSAYSLVSGNCEHFARWCKTGIWVSEQVQETHQSVMRTAIHAAVLLSNRLGSARIAIPSLAGEITEQVARCSLKRLNAAPQVVANGGILASYGTVAVLGLVLGGPTGSVSALAAHSWTRVATRTRSSS